MGKISVSGAGGGAKEAEIILVSSTFKGVSEQTVTLEAGKTYFVVATSANSGKPTETMYSTAGVLVKDGALTQIQAGWPKFTLSGQTLTIKENNLYSVRVNVYEIK